MSSCMLCTFIKIIPGERDRMQESDLSYKVSCSKTFEAKRFFFVVVESALLPFPLPGALPPKMFI